MAVAPTDTLSKIIDTLRATIAGSTTFQTWTGNVGDASGAKAEVYIEETDPTASGKRPFAVVGFDEGPEHEAIAGGSRTFFMLTGKVWVEFEAAITEDDSVDAFYEFSNKVGKIIEEIEALSGTPGYLDITDMRLTGIGRSRDGKETAEGAYYQAIYTFGYQSKGA